MAANLRSSAKLADLISDEGKAAFRGFIDSARHRRAGDMKALHVFRLPDGSYRSLDLGFISANLDGLLAKVSNFVLAMDPDQEILLQPIAHWWEFWTAPIIKGYMGYRCPLLKSSRVFLTVRGGEWPAA